MILGDSVRHLFEDLRIIFLAAHGLDSLFSVHPAGVDPLTVYVHQLDESFNVTLKRRYGGALVGF